MGMSSVAEKPLDEAAIMAVLETVPDPEIPVLSITDLGIVRGIKADPPRVQISPTYTGCPATLAMSMMCLGMRCSGFEQALGQGHRFRRTVAIGHFLKQLTAAAVLPGLLQGQAQEALQGRRGGQRFGQLGFKG